MLCWVRFKKAQEMRTRTGFTIISSRVSVSHGFQADTNPDGGAFSLNLVPAWILERGMVKLSCGVASLPPSTTSTLASARHCALLTN